MGIAESVRAFEERMRFFRRRGTVAKEILTAMEEKDTLFRGFTPEEEVIPSLIDVFERVMIGAAYIQDMDPQIMVSECALGKMLAWLREISTSHIELALVAAQGCPRSRLGQLYEDPFDVWSRERPQYLHWLYAIASVFCGYHGIDPDPDDEGNICSFSW
ncbi:MAG: hypothetical protein COU32_02745 [Candidatus Magasanikbacteria bacterium CG10_big_fil_rev_8_21_14_0_10_42_10]|uniref:Uncharacterized protein n=2 Tax=Candidatus Magasanikiibacteriota TaxID=1752731 RepID=A0A2H0TVV8_9BACT|nr:MAG: hypothetical protein COU32_02745 [Candidatus Magasanikbacteria bacterium CG10_big_fil_rev_8_21_14_0_10_42_10]PIZ94205.1 MAG: hypothetical protein COX82_01120 [Candidatus Magasanikbacteria bacterium CG_4_10_14_0_2_um_filter_41_10]